MSEKNTAQQPDQKPGYADSGFILTIKILLALAVVIGGLLLLVSLIDQSMSPNRPMALYILGGCFVTYFMVSIASDVHKVAYYTRKIAEATEKQPEEPKA